MSDMADELDDIEAAHNSIDGWRRSAHYHRGHLLKLARKQADALAKVEELIGWLDAASADDEPLYAKGKVSARATAKMLRDAIGVKA